MRCAARADRTRCRPRPTLQGPRERPRRSAAIRDDGRRPPAERGGYRLGSRQSVRGPPGERHGQRLGRAGAPTAGRMPGQRASRSVASRCESMSDPCGSGCIRAQPDRTARKNRTTLRIMSLTQCSAPSVLEDRHWASGRCQRGLRQNHSGFSDPSGSLSNLRLEIPRSGSSPPRRSRRSATRSNRSACAAAWRPT